MPKKIVAAKKLGINHTLVNHDALYVIEKLQQHGYDGYVVGGGVRDLILGAEPKDFDIVTNAAPEVVRKIFRRNSMIIGRRFKIVHVIFESINPEKFVNNRPVTGRHIVEISTYRSLKMLKRTINQHGKVTEDNQYGTQEEDAQRRDFTVNALFYDPIKEQVIDYNHGIKDLKDKILRIIGKPAQRYVEDPVRILRAMRLSVKLEFSIDKASMQPLLKCKDLLLHESRGRLYEEMLKILLCGSSYACIKQLKSIGLPRGVFPLFDRLFFKSRASAFATAVLKKTDARLKTTSDVSLVFILSGLLWDDISKLWHKLCAKSTSPRQALIDSTIEHEALVSEIGISKTAYAAMRNVWLLQLDFDAPPMINAKPEAAYIEHITRVPRFRQAWHLFCIRHELGQVNDKVYAWWASFVE